MAADGERVDCGDPQLFDAPSVHVVGHAVGRRDAAQELVHVAEVADQEPKVGNLAEVEMGEIDARAKNALTSIFFVIHDDAAHDGDLGRSVEGRHVDSNLGLSKGRVVFGVEKAWIDHVEVNGLAASRQARCAKIERAASSEFGAEGGAFRARQQHGVTQMLADARTRKHMRKEQALIDLDAVLVALRMNRLGLDLLSCRDQSRNEFRRGVNEVIEAAENRGALRQEVIDLLDVGGEKRFARSACVGRQRVRGRLLGLISPRLRWQPPKESRGPAPKGDAATSVGLKLADSGGDSV